jgi:hypothetical protein
MVLSDTVQEKDPKVKDFDYNKKKDERLKLREMKRSLRKLVLSKKKNSVKARILNHLIGAKSRDKESLLSDIANESRTMVIDKSKLDDSIIGDSTVRQNLKRTTVLEGINDFSSPGDSHDAKMHQSVK